VTYRDPHAPTAQPRGTRAWIYVLASPTAWLVQLETMYALAPPSRRPEHVLTIRWVSLAAFVVAAASAVGAWIEVRCTREALDGDRRGQGSHWLAVAGVALGLFFCLVIASMVLPTWILSPED
jgi:hypothetical protein